MSTDKLSDAIFFVIGSGTFFAIVYGPWQSLQVDIARQQIFQIRDAIFDIAAKSESFSFKSEEYRTVRESLNRLIRFAHLATWPIFLIPIQSGESPAQNAIKNIQDKDIREEIYALHSRAIWIVGRLAIFRSPLFCVVLMMSIPFYFVIKMLAGDWVEKFTGSLTKRVEIDSYQLDNGLA